MTAGAILAGGGATRYGGEPKGLKQVAGERIIDRVARVLSEALGAPPLLIANAPNADAWDTGLRLARDLRTGAGALGGIHAAVSQAPAPVVCVAWDMPFVTVPLVRALAAGLAGADAVLPESEGRRGLEPLCAAYGPACLAPIEASLDRGDLRAIAFHGAVRVEVLPLELVRTFGDPARLFFNVNTANDLREAEALWRHASSA